ncbi:MAG: DNA repair protein RadC [Candidatus Omnitrophota bacterium]|nr:MAG: DNA repair protein RadC [Candidatus Omnitrophota bacterium]
MHYAKSKKTIKDLPEAERPREKLMRYGPEKLSNSELLAILLRSGKKGEKEYFVIFYLDSRNQEIKREIISIGSLNANLVHPREVFEPAVRDLAAQIILAHNHPSGDPEPSEDDLTITKRLVEAGKIMGIEVVEHIIVVRNGFLSFKEKNLI